MLPPFGQLLLQGAKTKEIRSSGCPSKLGKTVALLWSGMAWGTVRVERAYLAAERVGEKRSAGENRYAWTEEGRGLCEDRAAHRVPDLLSVLTYKKVWVWELSGARRWERPVPYAHPKGAVVWVAGLASRLSGAAPLGGPLSPATGPKGRRAGEAELKNGEPNDTALAHG
jgi:hypothetical protein